MSFSVKNSDDDEILAQINIIPLVDVSLVLLIIFLVTVNHILTPSIRIKLPQSSNASNSTDIQNMNVSVTGEGVIYLDNDIVTMKELKDQVGKQHQQNPERGLVLNVDKAVYFQRVVDVLDAINELGISKLDIRTIKN